MVSAKAEKSIKNQYRIYRKQKLISIRFLKDFLRSNPNTEKYETIRDKSTVE